MTTLQSQVIAFHQQFGQEILPAPQIPSKKVIDLRIRLIGEEAFELFESLYGQQPEWEMCKTMIANVLLTKLPRVDLAEFADACGDLDYVVEGSRLAFGIDGESVAAAIHEANMAKVGGATGPDGKKLKPLQWTPPDIEGVLMKQASGELPNLEKRLQEHQQLAELEAKLAELKNAPSVAQASDIVEGIRRDQLGRE